MSDIDNDLPQSISVDFSNGSPLKNEDFLVVHYNMNSIRADDRLDELGNVCRVMKIDCLILTETKIDQTIPTNILNIPGFHDPIRHDRNLHGCGTMIYISKHLKYKHQTALQHQMFDHLWVDVRVSVNYLLLMHFTNLVNKYQMTNMNLF